MISAKLDEQGKALCLQLLQTRKLALLDNVSIQKAAEGARRSPGNPW